MSSFQYNNSYEFKHLDKKKSEINDVRFVDHFDTEKSEPLRRQITIIETNQTAEYGKTKICKLYETYNCSLMARNKDQ